MTDQEMQKMPMTEEEVQQFLADRKEAGKTIDVENCELSWGWAHTLDPYGVHTLSLEPNSGNSERYQAARNQEGERA